MLRVITCTMLRKDPGWASGSIACSLYYKKMNMQSNLKPSQDLCVAWCRLLHAAFHMPAQQERRSPQVAQQLFQHLGATAAACSPATTKQIPLPDDPYLLPLLLRVGDALHSRAGNTARDSALQRFQDSLLWTPEVRYGSCMSRFACVAWLEQG
jgi:hypothetical protein